MQQERAAGNALGEAPNRWHDGACTSRHHRPPHVSQRTVRSSLAVRFIVMCGLLWRFACYYAIEMQLHLAVYHPADAFNEAMGFVILLAAADNFVTRHAGRHHECRLINDLAARV